MRAAVILVILALVTSGCFAGGPDEPDEPAPTTAAPLEPIHPGVVAAAKRDAALAGAQMLESGGNAIDAAAAVQFALNVREPYFSGIGGGAFILLYLAQEDGLVLIDGRETAASGTRADQYENSDDANPDRMGYSVGVPGTLAAFTLALDTYGTKPLAETVEPAIRLAADGYEVDAYDTEMITLAQDELRSWPPSAQVFLQGAVCPTDTGPCVGGVPLAPGQTLVQPDLAKTFRTIAEHGLAAFYDGDIANAIAETTQVREGTMTTDDIRNYTAIEREPIHIRFEGVDVYSSPPPGGGIITLQALGILDGLDVGEMGATSAAGVHHTVEALRLAHADRAAHVADPAFVDVPTDGLLHPDYLAERRAQIDPMQSKDHAAGDPWPYDDGNDTGARGEAGPEGQHTTHFTVVDAYGNVASVTSTIESAFGTGMVVPGWGFLLNDELTDFTWSTGTINSPEPNKRPRSSTSPVIVLQDGVPILGVGSPGGTTIPSSVTEVTLNVLAHGMGLEDAVETGRYYPSAHPVIVWEASRGDWSPQTLQGLRDRGHEPYGQSSGIGNVNAVMRLESGAWVGAADTRQLGGDGVVIVEP